MMSTRLRRLVNKKEERENEFGFQYVHGGQLYQMKYGYYSSIYGYNTSAILIHVEGLFDDFFDILFT